MTESFVSRFVMAAPEGAAAKLCEILAGAKLMPEQVFASGEEALAAVNGGEALLLTTWKLPDMTGMELADRVGEQAAVLMIVPRDEQMEAAKHGNVLLLRNPLSPDALVQAVRAMMFCAERMHDMRARNEKLTRMLEERKVIERAKGRLMDTLHLSESEAHYRMQKKSMDTGRRIADIAREILASEEIVAC